MNTAYLIGLGAFGIIPLLVCIMFVAVLVIIVVQSARGTQRWNKNNHSPVLTVDVTVVAKRADVSHHHHNNGVNDMAPYTTSSTTYYATFQVTSGDRMEFMVPNTEYGMLVEQDHGKLTFQGTRYLGFERSTE